MQNLLKEGDVAIQGGRVPRNGLPQTMQAVKERMHWPRKSEEAGLGVDIIEYAEVVVTRMMIDLQDGGVGRDEACHPFEPGLGRPFATSPNWCAACRSSSSNAPAEPMEWKATQTPDIAAGLP